MAVTAGENRRFWADSVTDVGTTLLYPLGTRRFEEDDTYGTKTYRYVKHLNAVTVVAGHVATHVAAAITNYWNVTNDITGGASGAGSVLKPAGVYVSVIAQNGYGWIQTGGWKTNVYGDGSVAAAAFVMPSTTDAQATTSVAPGTPAVNTNSGQPLGYAYEADSGTPATFDCLITLE